MEFRTVDAMPFTKPGKLVFVHPWLRDLYCPLDGFVYLIINDEMISQIRHLTALVARLDPELQRAAKNSYAASLRVVFFLATCSTLLAYLVRLPIPQKNLEPSGRVKEGATSDVSRVEARTTGSARVVYSDDDEDETGREWVHRGGSTVTVGFRIHRRDSESGSSPLDSDYPSNNSS